MVYLFPCVCTMAGMEAVRAGDLGTFDLTVANILAAPLVRLHAILATLTRPGDGNIPSGGVGTCAENIKWGTFEGDPQYHSDVAGPRYAGPIILKD